MSTTLPHSGHDYSLLIEEWHRVAEQKGLRLEILCEANTHPVLVLSNEKYHASTSGGLYISTGIHGDECAPVWGLLDWVESEGASSILDNLPLLLFPCLNPSGLIDNRRHSYNDIDLNREFNNSDHPLIAAWRAYLKDRRFDCSACLHEDYDAQGIYLYELSAPEIASEGEELLQFCQHLIPREQAEEVDGSPCVDGLIFRNSGIERVVKENLHGGCPEAIYLFQHHTNRTYTYETPSELSLHHRMASHRLFLENLTQRLLKAVYNGGE